MTVWGDTKEEDREMFQYLKQRAKDRRALRAQAANEHMDVAAQYADDQLITVDPNGTWNLKLGGVSVQYWPTKGRWQYTNPKMIAAAKRRAKETGAAHYKYPVKATLFGGGISKFLQWLRKKREQLNVGQ